MNAISKALLLCLALPLPAAAASSVCFGTPERGRLSDGCKLPVSGSNFSVYSRLGSLAGRTYVHCTVRDVVTSAFAEVARTQPNTRYVYGETGFATGGEFRPHKTHQNGLSVDFFVPVRNQAGKSVPIPTSAVNRWGYDLEFDSLGRLGQLTIDFDAIATHLAALQRTAARNGVRIARVVFDLPLQQPLRRSAAWQRLRPDVPFSTRRGWWRHDEHYHVDFALPCKPL